MECAGAVATSPVLRAVPRSKWPGRAAQAHYSLCRAPASAATRPHSRAHVSRICTVLVTLVSRVFLYTLAPASRQSLSARAAAAAAVGVSDSGVAAGVSRRTPEHQLKQWPVFASPRQVNSHSLNWQQSACCRLQRPTGQRGRRHILPFTTVVAIVVAFRPSALARLRARLAHGFAHSRRQLALAPAVRAPLLRRLRSRHLSSFASALIAAAGRKFFVASASLDADPGADQRRRRVTRAV